MAVDVARAKELFLKIVDDPNRDEALERDCPEPELRQRVEALLTAHDRVAASGGYLTVARS